MGIKITDYKQALLGRRKITASGCWEWTGSRGHQGYGVCRWMNKTKVIPRISYELFIGPIPDGLFVLHRCDNPPCFNPEHLFAGTKKDNRLDQIAKGRDPAKNASHCKRGHEFSEANTLIHSTGRRQCVACKNMTQKQWASKCREVIDGEITISREQFNVAVNGSYRHDEENNLFVDLDMAWRQMASNDGGGE